MSKPELDRLAALARMVSQARLAELERAARARDESREKFAALNRPLPEGADLLALAPVALRYDRWAEARRREINLVLARQTATWLQALEVARGAFGRAEVLRKLAERKRP